MIDNLTTWGGTPALAAAGLVLLIGAAVLRSRRRGDSAEAVQALGAVALGVAVSALATFAAILAVLAALLIWQPSGEVALVLAGFPVLVAAAGTVATVHVARGRSAARILVAAD